MTNRTSNKKDRASAFVPQVPKVSIGIDAGVVAPHQVAVRGPRVSEHFRVPPTLAGMRALTAPARPPLDGLSGAGPAPFGT
jgi:hypothetical protein